MPFAEVGGLRIFYELKGDAGQHVILQVGGPMFGRHNFRGVNDKFLANFRLLSYDASGYGRSDHPLENYSIEAWAEEAVGLLDQLGIDRVFVHGTSMGGMIALLVTATHPDRVIATCADCTYARPDEARRVLLRTWRRMIEAMPLDDFCDLLTSESVSASFLEAHPELYEGTRTAVRTNSTFTLRQSCLARERMDLEPVVTRIRRPVLFTNGSDDILTPARLAPSGYGVEKIVAAVPAYASYHEFPGARHAGLLECPDEAVKVVTDFFLRNASQ